MTTPFFHRNTTVRNWNNLPVLALSVVFNVIFSVATTSAQQPSPGEDNTPSATSNTEKPVPPSGQSSGSSDYTRRESALDTLNRAPEKGSVGEQALRAQKASQQNMEDKAKAAEALGLKRMEDPVLRAQFERYLGMPEVTEEHLKSYKTELEKLNTSLQKDQIFEAWKQLLILAEFKSIDAGVSRELANRIESIWNTGRATGDIASRNQELRRDIVGFNWRADTRMNSIIEREAEWQRLKNHGASGKSSSPKNNGGVPQEGGGGNDGGGGSASINGLEGRMQLTEDYLHSLEAKAKIKLNELRIQKLLDAAKADFATYIGALYQSHRYQHVILAADFYRRLFKDDTYPVEVAKQVNAALEMDVEVINTIETFRYKLERNDLAGASDRLQEAFVASEFHPAVLILPRKDKERVADFIERLSKMQNLIEAHDFGELEAMLKETQAQTRDFDAAKPRALVNAVKLESRLRLGKAKLAAQQGNTALAMEEFQAAAEAWPANPQLDEAATLFFEKADTQNQIVTEFDRLVIEQNIRGIFEKQIAFAPAIVGDTKREAALKSALEKIKQAEIAYEKATLQRNAGDVFGAWETIEAATADLPNDNKLNMLRAELSGKGAEFVAAINKAKDAEAKQEWGYSLSCYAVAQRYYPASTIANAGLQRIARQMFGGNQPVGDVPASASGTSGRATREGLESPPPKPLGADTPTPGSFQPRGEAGTP